MNPAVLSATSVVLVDLETSPRGVDLVPSEGDFVLGFVSERGAQVLELGLPDFELVVLRGERSKAITVAIIWHLARLHFREGLRPLTPVWVVSADRTASFLEEAVGPGSGPGCLRGLQVVPLDQYVAATRPQFRPSTIAGGGSSGSFSVGGALPPSVSAGAVSDPV